VRAASLAALALVVVALTVTAFATAGKLGVWQASGPTLREPLDPATVAGGDTDRPLPSGVCPPLPEQPGSKGSDAEFTGVCAFHQAGPVNCRTSADDFYVLLRRELSAGRSLSLYANVEGYHGPGAYREVQLLMLVEDAGTIYEWSNFRAQGRVTEREASFVLPATELRSETGRAGAGLESVSGALGCG